MSKTPDDFPHGGEVLKALNDAVEKYRQWAESESAPPNPNPFELGEIKNALLVIVLAVGRGREKAELR